MAQTPERLLERIGRRTGRVRRLEQIGPSIELARDGGNVACRPRAFGDLKPALFAVCSKDLGRPRRAGFRTLRRATREDLPPNLDRKDGVRARSRRPARAPTGPSSARFGAGRGLILARPETFDEKDRVRAGWMAFFDASSFEPPTVTWSPMTLGARTSNWTALSCTGWVQRAQPARSVQEGLASHPRPSFTTVSLSHPKPRRRRRRRAHASGSGASGSRPSRPRCRRSAGRRRRSTTPSPGGRGCRRFT